MIKFAGILPQRFGLGTGWNNTKELAWTRRGGRIVQFGCWLYLAAVLVIWAIVGWAGDRWWPASVMMFGPRWIYALPLVILVPAVVVFRRWALWPLGIVLVIIVGPLMGFCMPWQSLVAAKTPEPRVRVLSCNVHYGQLDPVALGLVIKETQPDIVALQGWLGKHRPIVFAEGAWHVRRDGELCLGTRYEIRGVEVGADWEFREGRGALAQYHIEWPVGTIPFFNIHLASPRTGLEALADHRPGAGAILQANSTLRRTQAEVIRRLTIEGGSRTLLAGDFNTPPDSAIYAEFWSPFRNAFSEAGWGWGHTFFTRRAAIRIDHQLAGPGWRCRRCWVGPEVGSPHRPLIADWEWTIRHD